MKINKLNKVKMKIAKINITDVEFSRVVGTGAFGKVRKCFIKSDKNLVDLSTSSDDSNGEKFSFKDPMAVKIMSKH